MKMLSEKLAIDKGRHFHWCPGCKQLHVIDVEQPNHLGAKW